jgi:hypothetical protein
MFVLQVMPNCLEMLSREVQQKLDLGISIRLHLGW